MLPVCVQSDQHVENNFSQGITEPREQCGALAAVPGKRKQVDAALTCRGDGGEDLSGCVSRTVIDSNHMVGVLRRLTHDLATERGDVVTRDHATNHRRGLRRACGGTRNNAYARGGDWHLAPPGLVKEAEAALQLDERAPRRRQHRKWEP